MNQGRNQDFSEARTILQIALNPPPPPPLKKKFLDERFGYVVSLRVFSGYEMTLATYEILFQVFGSID